MFLKFTWHLTGLVKSKQITLAPITTEYSMHQMKMIIRVSHCSSSAIIVSGHNAGSTETQRDRERDSNRHDGGRGRTETGSEDKETKWLKWLSSN